MAQTTIKGDLYVEGNIRAKGDVFSGAPTSANVTLGTTTSCITIASGTAGVGVGGSGMALTQDGWITVNNKQEHIKYLWEYNLRVIDLRHNDLKGEADRVKLDVSGYIELLSTKSPGDAIKLRHAADFAKIHDIEYMHVEVKANKYWVLEQKVD